MTTRSPARRSTAAPARPPVHCPDNDCQREQAQALSRIAAVIEAAQADFHELKPILVNLGEIAGKWLRFCAFVRKWFPKVGWWLLPIVITALSKGSSEAMDQLIHALTVFLQTQAGGGA